MYMDSDVYILQNISVLFSIQFYDGRKNTVVVSFFHYVENIGQLSNFQ